MEQPSAIYNTQPAQRRYKLIFGVADESRVRVCVYVSNNISLDSWNAKVHNLDLITVNLETQLGLIHLHAIYNLSPSRQSSSNETSTLPSLAVAMESLSGHHILVGDLNLHQPLWTGPNFDHEHPQSQDLINIIIRHQLELALEPETNTFPETPHHRGTTIDLVFVSPTIAGRITRCATMEEH